MGLFITFEGGEGTGKSTQLSRLAGRIRASGRGVTMTREPGGTPAAEDLRQLLVSGEPGRWSATAEALLNSAARDAHLAGVVRPALAAGEIVLCDRFMDSTRAYQGYAGGCSFDLIDALETAVVGPTQPDLTLVFDLDPECGLARARSRGEGEDRYERKGLDFHRRLRAGFLSIQQQNPRRCRLIDASANPDQVEAAVWAIVEPRL